MTNVSLIPFTPDEQDRTRAFAYTVLTLRDVGLNLVSALRGLGSKPIRPLLLSPMSFPGATALVHWGPTNTDGFGKPATWVRAGDLYKALAAFQYPDARTAAMYFAALNPAQCVAVLWWGATPPPA